MATLGGVVVLMSVFALLTRPKRLEEYSIRPIIVPAPTLGGNTQATIQELNLWNPNSAKLSADIDPVPVVYVNEPFPINLNVDILTSDVDDPLLELYQPPEFNLSGAGVEVQPNEWLTPARAKSATVSWSVVGHRPGPYQLVLNTRQRPVDLKELIATFRKKPRYRKYVPELEKLQSGLTQIDFPHGRIVPITVRNHWVDYAKTIGTVFAAFMGSLLTLPGILSYLKDRREEREKIEKAQREGSFSLMVDRGSLPKYYVLDTNIWLDLRRGKVSCYELSSRAQVVVEPFVIMELMKETVKHKGKYFESDKRVFQCMSQCRILELTKVFIHQRLWNSGEEASTKVRPENYRKLLHMMVDSGSYDEFIKKTKSAGSEWSQAETWDVTHEGVLDKELLAVEQLSKVDPKSIATGFVKLYPFKGSFPKEDSIEKEFSAALEYLRSVIAKVRNGANLPKNDRGMYVDFQILFYLADPNATIVSNEDFSSEISKSPQKDRIITLSQFLAL